MTIPQIICLAYWGIILLIVLAALVKTPGITAKLGNLTLLGLHAAMITLTARNF